MTHDLLVYLSKTVGLIWLMGFFLIVVIRTYSPSRRATYEAAQALPLNYRMACIQRIPVAATLLARRAKLRRLDPAGAGPAWGVLALFRQHSLCFRVGRAWFASSSTGGLVRIPARVVRFAWSLD